MERSRGHSTRSTVLRKRVVHLVGSLGLGGVQVQLEQLLSRFSSEFDHQVVTLFEGGDLTPRIEASGFKVTHCDLQEAGRLERVVRARAVFQSLKPDIVHAHGRVASNIGAAAGYKAGIVGRIGHLYAPPPERADEQGGSKRLLRSIGRSHLLLFCSEAVRTQYMTRKEYPLGVPTEIVPCGINLNSTSTLTDCHNPVNSRGADADRKRPVIGTLSRIVPEKNHALLIDAAALLRDAGHDFEISIVGLGEAAYISRIRERAERKGLLSRVQFAGYIENTYEALASMDVFVLCSKSEGMPLCILEAWAGGVPVVGTRVPGIEDLVHEGIDGVLCSPASPESLAEALEHLLMDENLRTRLRRGGRRTVSGFGVARMAETLESIYGNCLSRQVRP